MEEITVAVFLLLLLWVAVMDWKTMEISNGVLVLILICVLVSMSTDSDLCVKERIFGFFAASGILFGITCLFPGAFGGGDIKMMAVCGGFLGWKRILLALYLAILAGGVWAGLLWCSGRKHAGDTIPFGPFLSLGTAIVCLRGNEILHWYLKMTGLK